MSWIKTDMLRIYKNKGPLIAIFSIALILFQEGMITGLWEGIQGHLRSNTGTEFFAMTVFFSGITIAIPLVATFLYSTCFCEEYETGAIFTFLHRSKSYLSYTFRKISCVWFSSFLISFLPIFIYGILCLQVGVKYNLEEVKVLLAERSTKEGFLSVYSFHPLRDVFLQSFAFGCYSATCGIMAFAASAFYPNKYFVWCLPLIICYTANFLFPRIGLELLNPMESINFTYVSTELFPETPYAGVIYFVLYHVIALFICTSLFYFRMKKRITYEGSKV